MSSQEIPSIYLKDYAPSAFLIPEVFLDVAFGKDKTTVSAKLNVTPHTKDALVLDGENLSLLSIAIDGIALTAQQYSVSDDKLTIPAVPNGPFVLETVVEIDPHNNTELMGLYQSNGVWCTQCEAEGFRRITYFLDRPDVLSTYTVRMTAEKASAPILLANGNPTDAGTLPDGLHFAQWHDPHPKPSYLFAMVAGNLDKLTDSFVTASGRAVELAIYCEHGKAGACVYAMDALKRSMIWDERRFGREYDLDVFNIVAVSDFNFGAMENKGLNIFNDRFVLADAETATDTDYANIERIIAHEYFHNWTGNRITCRDWFQLCLKEGLTVYRDQEFTSDERSRAVKRISDVRGLRAAQFPEDSGPLAHPARPEKYKEINNFYTATVYEKGAEIVRMLATLLGTEEFRKGTDAYFERHDGSATTIEAWLKIFEETTGRSFEQFGKWYTQAGTPEVTVKDAWDATSGTYRLWLSQKTPETPGQANKEAMIIPIKFGLVGPNGADMSWRSVRGATVAEDMIILDTENAEVIFEGVSKRPVPSLFREFSAPVNVRSTASDEDKLFLARQDNDPFNRWQALQDVAMSVMLETLHTGSPHIPSEKAVSNLVAALRETLESADLDDAYKAEVLSMPSEGAVAQVVKINIDPTAIHTTRRHLLRAIGRRLEPQLSALYERLANHCIPYSQEAASTRARALRNQCLSLLAAAGTDTANGLLSAQYRSADNMTDRVAALGVAVACDAPSTSELLADFKKRFGDNPLILDKWLALIASMPSAEVIRRMEVVLADPKFPRTNPNRLRSLVGTFAMGNIAQFARKDGAGFKFVARFCREIDGTNPQVAARVLTAFRSWRNFEPNRREAAHAALVLLRDGGPLSRNTSDILTRTLEG